MTYRVTDLSQAKRLIGQTNLQGWKWKGNWK